jgi:hypothetical protein
LNRVLFACIFIALDNVLERAFCVGLTEGPGTVKYVINLIGGSGTGSISMENAVSGAENTQRTFSVRPTVCHK